LQYFDVFDQFPHEGKKAFTQAHCDGLELFGLIRFIKRFARLDYLSVSDQQ
jgi:hypothetical protein